MKKKVCNGIIVILILLYLGIMFCDSHNDWIDGITMEEMTKEDMLIWN